MALPLYKTAILKITTPHMRDGAGLLKGSHLIRDTQYLLNDNSTNKRTGKSFGDHYAGRLDGEYGPYTASAVRMMKWYMGYPSNEVNSVAGPTFQAYLRGDEKIPLTYNVRRNSRLKAAKEATTIRQKAFAKGVSQVGTKESPAFSNRVLYSEWYGIIGPWCAMFITWCFVQVGSKRFQRASRYAYVPFVYADAKYGRNGLHLTTNPAQGDLVVFQLPGHYEPNHIGIFDRWVDRTHGVFATVEGNTGSVSFDNGGEVLRNTRYTWQVKGFVHVLEP